MDCTSCGAPLPPKTTRCTFCGTLNEVDLRGRVSVRRGTTDRKCPRCTAGLEAVLLAVGAESVEIDRCPECNGLFFDPGELDQVLDGIETRAEVVDHRALLTLIEEETPTDDFERVTYASCPECGQLMHRRNFGQRSGVIIDSCRDHGLWLDGGELRRLIRWTQAGGRQHHAQSQAEKERMQERAARTPPVVDSASWPQGRIEKDSTWSRRGAWDVLDALELVVDFFRAAT